MFAGSPTVVEQSGSDVQLQSVEFEDEHVLVRLRANEMEAVGRHNTLRPVVMREAFSLTDGNGLTLVFVQSSSDSGPFAGIVDLAFERVPAFDDASELMLRSEKVNIRFRV